MLEVLNLLIMPNNTFLLLCMIRFVKKRLLTKNTFHLVLFIIIGPHSFLNTPMTCFMPNYVRQSIRLLVRLMNSEGWIRCLTWLNGRYTIYISRLMHIVGLMNYIYKIAEQAKI